MSFPLNPIASSISTWTAAEETQRIRVQWIGSDPQARAAILRAMLQEQDFSLLQGAASGEEALRLARAQQPDAIFIDIETIEQSGLAIEPLFYQPSRPVIVFLARHREHALRAFDLGVSDYLLKPLRHDRLLSSLNRIRAHVRHRAALDRESQPAQQPARITVQDRKQSRVLDPNEIEWINAAGDYTELHVRGTAYLLREPLSALLGRLPANVFCRIHRSFAVNLGSVSGFRTIRNQDLLVRLKDKTVLRASRTFSDGLKKAIMQLCA